jgi:hypothetical protein
VENKNTGQLPSGGLAEIEKFMVPPETPQRGLAAIGSSFCPVPSEKVEAIHPLLANLSKFDEAGRLVPMH